MPEKNFLVKAAATPRTIAKIIETNPYWTGKSFERFLIKFEKGPKFFVPLKVASLIDLEQKKCHKQ